MVLPYPGSVMAWELQAGGGWVLTTFLTLVEMQTVTEHPLSSRHSALMSLGSRQPISRYSSRSHRSAPTGLGEARLSTDQSLHQMSTLSLLSNCELHSPAGIVFPVMQDPAPAFRTSKLVVT